MSQDYRYILRIKGTDVPGTLKTVYGIARIKGVSLNLANAILKKTGINPNIRAGFLSENEIAKIEEIVEDPTKFGLPAWLLNKRKDTETGKDTHLISSELIYRTKKDIDLAKEIKSWRGYRHAYGLKVRGQRTKTTGRAGKSLGVKKKSLRSGGK
ncbi:MAG: 30S ribosomal protein S13 [Candidatus Bathyarchaeota archaeon]|jgi:small subunit ribosomal protein S13|nr:30S ribosomal protein S13 [Candidatus Bathyarchaeota archaeon]